MTPKAETLKEKIKKMKTMLSKATINHIKKATMGKMAILKTV